jgi:hypothetical protein
MKVERKNNELIVRIPAGLQVEKIQAILDYLRYEELTSKSAASQDEVDRMVKEAKKDRWHTVKN